MLLTHQQRTDCWDRQTVQKYATYTPTEDRLLGTHYAEICYLHTNRGQTDCAEICYLHTNRGQTDCAEICYLHTNRGQTVGDTLCRNMLLTHQQRTDRLCRNMLLTHQQRTDCCRNMLLTHQQRTDLGHTNRDRQTVQKHATYTPTEDRLLGQTDCAEICYLHTNRGQTVGTDRLCRNMLLTHQQRTDRLCRNMLLTHQQRTDCWERNMLLTHQQRTDCWGQTDCAEICYLHTNRGQTVGTDRLCRNMLLTHQQRTDCWDRQTVQKYATYTPTEDRQTVQKYATYTPTEDRQTVQKYATYTPTEDRLLGQTDCAEICYLHTNRGQTVGTDRLQKYATYTPTEDGQTVRKYATYTPTEDGLLGTDSVKAATAKDEDWLVSWDRMSSLSRVMSSSVNSASLCLELASSFSWNMANSFTFQMDVVKNGANSFTF